MKRLFRPALMVLLSLPATAFAALFMLSAMGSGGATDWWATESAQAVAAGGWAEDFDESTDVTGWRWNNDVSGFDPTGAGSGSDKMTWQSSGGIENGGFLRIEDFVGVSSIYWSRNLDPQYTSGNSTHSIVVGPGGDYQTIHAAWAMRINAASLASSIVSGIKIFEFSTAFNSNVNQESFMTTYYVHDGGVDHGPSLRGATSNCSYNPGTCEGYGGLGEQWEYIPLMGGADFDLHPKIGQSATCKYSTRPSGCYLFQADTWVYYLMTITLGAENDDTTYGKLAYASGGQWVTITERDDLNLHTFETIDGYSAILAWYRTEGQSGGSTGEYHDFDRIMWSPNPIDPPSP